MKNNFEKRKLGVYHFTFRDERMVETLHVEAVDNGEELDVWFYIEGYLRKDYLSCWPYKSHKRTIEDTLDVIVEKFEEDGYILYVEYLRKTAVIENDLSVLQRFRELLTENCNENYEIDDDEDEDCENCEECPHREYCDSRHD